MLPSIHATRCDPVHSTIYPRVLLFGLLAAVWLLGGAPRAAEPAAAVRIEVRPALVSLSPGQRQHFQAHALDGSGAQRPFAAQWSTEPGARIDASGLFVSHTPGRYTVVAGDAEGRVVGTAVAIVQPARAPLGEIVVRPREVRLVRGDTVQFQALLLDRDGNARQARLLWQARGGQIDQNGLFTAGTKPGRYRITVLDRRSRLQAGAVVEIVQP